MKKWLLVFLPALLLACTPIAHKNSLNRNADYPENVKRKTQFIKVIYGVTGYVEINDAVLESFNKCYKTTDEDSIKYLFNKDFCEGLKEKYTSLPWTVSVHKIDVLPTGDFPREYRVIEENHFIDNQLSRLITREPRDLNAFFEEYNDFDYAIFFGDIKIESTSIEHKTANIAKPVNGQIEFISFDLPAINVIIPQIIYDVKRKIWFQQGFTRSQHSFPEKTDDVKDIGTAIGAKIVTTLDEKK